jgi:tetratricopeptide (TPR) repeat protein
MIASLLLVLVFTFSESDSFELLIQRGLDHSFNEEYDQAKSCFEEAIVMEPEHPLGYFVYAGLYRIYASDFVTDSLLDSFFVYAEITADKARAMIDKKLQRAWAYYFLGGINMYLSSVCIEKGEYVPALGYAEQSMEDISRCLAMDEELYDAYLVMGSYEYLKGSFPLWGAYKDRGITKIRIAAEKSRYARPVARNILTLLLQREKRYDEALQEAEALASAYPESRTFLWTLSKVYLAKEDWDKAIESYGRLLENILEEQPENLYNVIQAKLGLATAYVRRDEPGKAVPLCNEIVEKGAGHREMKHMVKDAQILLKKAQAEQ